MQRSPTKAALPETSQDPDAARNGPPEPFSIWKAQAFIHTHVNEQLSLGRVSRAVNLCAQHFSEKFKEVTGSNFVQYVARARFEKSLSLLQNPELRITEAAFTAGFQSLSQFNRVFKGFAGQSPTQYRAERFDRASLDPASRDVAASLQTVDDLIQARP
jgi:AraC-like DNA-binding protein